MNTDPTSDAPVTTKGMLASVLLAGVVVINFLIGTGIRYTLEKFRTERSQAYRDLIKKNISELQARL
jgi:hypothetical protein